MNYRKSLLVMAAGFGLSAAIAGACGTPPQLSQLDEDEDGFPSKTDCDDGDNDINPSEFEDCSDGKDNDCDEKVDGADTECGAPTGGPGGVGGGGGAGGGGGGGGAGGSGPCEATCIDAVSNGASVCSDAPSASVSAYGALIMCACGDGFCTSVCLDEFCVANNINDVMSGSPCQTCLGDAANGCGDEITACFNN